MTTNRLLVSIASFLSIFALTAIVSLAIGTDRLGDLVGGVFVIGVISGGWAAVGVALYSRMSASRATREALRYDFIYKMADKGALPNDGSFIPLRAQLPAPQAKQGNVLQIFDFNPNDIHTASVNYIMFSAALLGDSGNRLASAPECRMATNIVNYSDRTRDRIVKHLSAQYGVSTQAGPVDNGGGTFVPAEFGTVGGIYHHIILNSAVEAIPELVR